MTGRGRALPHTSRVGLVGGSPYHRDVVRGWLADARCVLSITPIVDDRRQHGRHPETGSAIGGPGGTGDGIDVIVGIIDDPEDPALARCCQLTDAGRARSFVAVLLTLDRRGLQAAVDAGAGGVVAAASGPASLADAVAAVARGAAWLDPALSPIVLERMGRPAPDDEFGLTPMEQRVAAYFPKGLTNREIGDQLGVGEETVKSHVSNLYRKLDVCDRMSAVTLLQGRLPQLQPAAAGPEPSAAGTRSSSR